MKIRKGDEVLVTRGKDSGKKGKIIRLNPRDSRVTVEGTNLEKRHLRPKRQGAKGEMIFVPRSIPVANVRIVCPSCSKITRIGWRFEDDKKVRICKKCQSVLN